MASATALRLARYREMGDDYENNLKVDDICRKHDCHPSDVYRAIDRLGIPRRQDIKENGPNSEPVEAASDTPEEHTDQSQCTCSSPTETKEEK